MSGKNQISHDGKRYESKSFVFPGGELQVQVPDLPAAFIGDTTVLTRFQSAEALVHLPLTTEVLYRAHRSGNRRLVIPYSPCGRQDRVMRPNEAFSLKPDACLINSLGFDEVVVCDQAETVQEAA